MKILSGRILRLLEGRGFGLRETEGQNVLSMYCTKLLLDKVNDKQRNGITH